MATQKLGIIGEGNVGGALAKGLRNAGHDVRTVAADPAALRELAGWADVLILAVPFGAIDDVVATIGPLAGKVLIDATNALDASWQLALGFDTSGAEQLQRKVPGARVVKAFNTVFAQHMATGHLADEQLTALVASDDADAKAITLGLARDLGFDGIDAGPLKNARTLEPLAFLNIQLGYVLGMGPQIGFKLLHA